jgi:hypothetical protein
MNWVTKRADGLQQFLPGNKATFFISVASLQAALELFFPANVISPEACRLAGTGLAASIAAFKMLDESILKQRVIIKKAFC